jgi:preprotein translocase subunit SecG
MIALLVVIHVLVCVTLIGVVLLQQGKGADVGAVFGGSSQTVFGASGAGNLLTKVTGICAVIFFATSLILAYSSTRHATSSIFEGLKVPPRNLPPGNLGAPVTPPPLTSNAPGTAGGTTGAAGHPSATMGSPAAGAPAAPVGSVTTGKAAVPPAEADQKKAPAGSAH